MHQFQNQMQLLMEIFYQFLMAGLVVLGVVVVFAGLMALCYFAALSIKKRLQK